MMEGIVDKQWSLYTFGHLLKLARSLPNFAQQLRTTYNNVRLDSSGDEDDVDDEEIRSGMKKGCLTCL